MSSKASSPRGNPGATAAHDAEAAVITANGYLLRHYSTSVMGGSARRLPPPQVHHWEVPIIFTSPGYGSRWRGWGSDRRRPHRLHHRRYTRKKRSGRRSSGCPRRSRMPSKPTFVEQERRDSCALACLRMLLAHDGVDVSESELLEEVAPAEAAGSLLTKSPGYSVSTSIRDDSGRPRKSRKMS